MKLQSGLLTLSSGVWMLIMLSCHSGNSQSGQHIPGDTVTKHQPLLTLESKIVLPEVKGGFDLMTVDTTSHRLFVCAEDNHSLEVVDLKTGKRLRSIPGLDEPHWVFYYPEKRRFYVATGGDGKVTEFDGKSYKRLKEFTFKESCNNLRYDKDSQQLWVGVGKFFGALGVIDLAQDKIIREIPLSGYLKQFEIDGDRIYVNIPDKDQVDVVDRNAGKVIATWPLKAAKQNVPMALDAAHQRLFVGCRSGQLVVLSTKTGAMISSLPISEGTDGIYYDKKRARIYVSCGDGFIHVIQQTDGDHYQNIGKIATAEGAATSLYSASLDRLFLAVPGSKNREAGIRIYQP